MKNNASFAYALLLIIGDFVALLAAFSLAYILRVKFDPRPLIEQIPAVTYFYTFATVLPLWILVHAFIGLYNQSNYEKRFAELGRLFVGSFLGILVVIGYDFIANKGLFPARLVPIYGLGIGFGFLLLFRSLARIFKRLLYSYGIWVTNVLIVGDSDQSLVVASAIQNTALTGQRVLGIVGRHSGDFTNFSSFSEATHSLKESLQSIIQTQLYADQSKNDAILQYAQQNHISYRFVPGNSDLYVGKMAVELFANGIPMITVHQTALIGWGRIAKRIFDLLAGGLFLIVVSPLMLIIAILVKLTDLNGPVLMRGKQQNRLTRHDTVFKVYKFRSHYAKYDGKTEQEVFDMVGKPELLDQYRKNGNQLKDDFRITPFGKFMRRYSLDELPQLINVIKGDISLVGPRSLVASELEEYKKRHTILSVKSGLTGLAQISGRRNISFEERRRLDVYYVQNWSFWLDISILLKTLRVVLSGKGAS